MKKNCALRLISLVFLVAFIVGATSCSNNESGGQNAQIKRNDHTYYGYFDTVASIYDYSGRSDAEFRYVCETLMELTEKYHELFDIYNEYDGVTNIAYLNSMAGKGAVSVSEDIIKFLEYSKDMYEKTDGYVNIAMGAVLSMWHDSRSAGISNPASASLPNEQKLLEASEHCNIDDLVIDRENMTVELRDERMSLDVGAIAKGYTVERLAQWLLENEYFGFVIDIGGNLRVIGTKPDGSGWKTGVKNPFTLVDYVHVFELSNESAVTSGGYERYFVVDGVRYHHIIDKDTLMPSVHFASVSVVCEDSGLADALSTALFCMDIDNGMRIASDLGVNNVIWVMQDGTVKTLK